jgi:hypothetical protein
VELVFVNPLAALAALAVVVPLWALRRGQRRSRQVREGLGLEAPARRSGLLVAAAIVAVAALVGAAAAQPVLLERQPQYVRTDAEVFAVFDVTQSMLAARAEGQPTRLQRAEEAALEIRSRLSDVPVGIASFTNRIVPHLFPTANHAVFRSTVTKAVGIERPPPDQAPGALLTALAALAPLRTHNFFSPEATARVAVVFTDGETLPLPPAAALALQREPRVSLVFVRVWAPDERIFSGPPHVRRYQPDPDSTARFEEIAGSLGAPVFTVADTDSVAATVRRVVGRGELVRAGDEVSARPLTAWAVALIVVPLGFLLRRRNL